MSRSPGGHRPNDLLMTPEAAFRKAATRPIEEPPKTPSIPSKRDGHDPHQSGCARVLPGGRPWLAGSNQCSSEGGGWQVSDGFLKQANRISRHMILALLFLGATGCASSSLSIRPSLGTCEAGDQSMVRDTLYFGRNRPHGGTVREAEWRQFLNEVITPRFPDGLTVVKATGQWRNASGQIEREASQVVTLIHAGDPTAQHKVSEITAEYRQRFDQEAVLRERTATCARF